METMGLKCEVALERAEHAAAQAVFRKIGLDRMFGSDFDDPAQHSIAQMRLGLVETLDKE